MIHDLFAIVTISPGRSQTVLSFWFSQVNVLSCSSKSKFHNNVASVERTMMVAKLSWSQSRPPVREEPMENLLLSDAASWSKSKWLNCSLIVVREALGSVWQVSFGKEGVWICEVRRRVCSSISCNFDRSLDGASARLVSMRGMVALRS